MRQTETIEAAIKANLKPKKVLGYMVMPRVIPRIKDLFSSGFGWLAILMALVYQSVRLLPANHPYTNPANQGRFGLRHVIAEAANNLTFRKENIDQIIVFFALLGGLIMLGAQLVMFAVSMIISPAFASFAGLFQTPSPNDDIAFMMLDLIFGVPDLYGSKYAPAVGSIPPFQQALHTLFKYYSTMILIVAVFVLLYYIVVTLGETVTTGVPFGKRFNSIYAPFRLVIAVGLLVPLNYGLNAGQYITLYAAKYGSSFATNGWILFNKTVTNPTTDHDEALLARPTVPDTSKITQFMLIVQACRYSYDMLYGSPQDGSAPIEIKAYYVRNSDPSGGGGPLHQEVFGAGMTNWEDGLKFFNYGDITVRFGDYNPTRWQNETGNVMPFCGEMTFHTTSMDDKAGITTDAEDIQQQYLRMIDFMWGSPINQNFGKRAAYIGLYKIANTPKPCSINFAEESGCDDDNAKLPPIAYKIQRSTQMQNMFLGQVQSAYITYAPPYAIPKELLDRGWGGAAIWYNKIAEWNGAFTDAVMNIPTPSKMPSVMEATRKQNEKNNQNLTDKERYRPNLADGRKTEFSMKGEENIAPILNDAYTYWYNGNGQKWPDEQINSNVIISTISTIFGLNGLFDMQRNADTNPLASMVSAGKAIINAAIRNLMGGLLVGGLGAVLEPQGAGLISAAGNLLVTFATVGITVGFILFYILPFLPFMYFFFAVGGWVKSIFEAMVGVPLWALAHLRIDGNGIPSDTASAGYFLIFEIFVRPILTVFGLLGAMAIFTAMVRVLHDIFPLVTSNLTGFDSTAPKGGIDFWVVELKRDPVDEFMFTVIYTILVYMIATSSFKMIDQVPNNILRWMGAGTQSFNDQREDAIPGLIQYAGVGGYGMATQVTGALQAASTGAGRTVGQAGRAMFGLASRGGKATGA